jgi:hypothetical protein
MLSACGVLGRSHNRWRAAREAIGSDLASRTLAPARLAWAEDPAQLPRLVEERALHVAGLACATRDF